MQCTPQILDSIAEVSPEAWNTLLPGAVGSRYPFTSHEFLLALEASQSVGADLGWRPRHMILRDKNQQLCAAAPVYEKLNSYGEFVFDFSWAQAYQQAGGQYYPKLICAVPFSPVTGPRLLANSEAARMALCQQLMKLPGEQAASSLHMLFAQQSDYTQLAQHGAVLRRDCQYQWFNRDYPNFDAFLETLTSKRRKEIRRERRRVAEGGIKMYIHSPDDIDEALWQTLYIFYSRTYLVRGQRPYLTPDFFRLIARLLPEQVLFFVAYRDDEPVAMAFMLKDKDTLYGRHWGCLEDYHSLHFETCYYAGIEYCIRHGLRRFDAGAQGEHKIRRGFEPVASYSAHYLCHSGLQAAVTDFVRREGEMIGNYHADLRTQCAFPDAAELTL